MIQTFINRAITTRPPPHRSALDLPEREIFSEHDTKALDRFDDQRDLNGRYELNEQRAPTAARRAEDDQAALSESSVIAAGPPAASTPGGAWRALRVALLILCINFAAAALIATVVFKPSLALLGFFVEFCVISLTGLPMLLATVSEALESNHA